MFSLKNESEIEWHLVCVYVWLCVDVFPKQGDEWDILSLFLKKESNTFILFFIFSLIAYLFKQKRYSS